ncbi:hypothetical protein T06_14427 [Trichinella sp. T6]|nr:hypothetical protein T09_956 [Trichinella sp. T9]KRX85734.1 hypothetical protein T06_14427 [Trichinella sp. T6]
MTKRVSSLARPLMAFTLVEAALQIAQRRLLSERKKAICQPQGANADKPKDDTIGKNEWKGAPVSRR